MGCGCCGIDNLVVSLQFIKLAAGGPSSMFKRRVCRRRRRRCAASSEKLVAIIYIFALRSDELGKVGDWNVLREFSILFEKTKKLKIL